MRQFLVLRSDEKLVDRCRDHKVLHARPLDLLHDLKVPGNLARALEGIKMIAAPQTHSRSTIAGDPEPRQQLSEVVISYQFPNKGAVDDLRAFLRDRLGDMHDEAHAVLPAEAAALIRNIGADPQAHPCMLFPCSPAVAFGNRSRVREMMDINALNGLTGRDVNVVIVDQGLNKAEIIARKPRNWGGGLASTPAIDPATGEPTGAAVEPGSAPSSSHGMMIARNVLDIAPDATLYDVPLIPLRISRPNVFASSAHATLKAVIEKIHHLKHHRGKDSAWIVVNAWAIFDRAGEYPEGDYTRNTHMNEYCSGRVRFGHPLNRLMDVAARERIDVVFGAGNCGQFTIETRCGRNDRGEGHSIWGANAHPAVLTVGAVTANTHWFGYSSEGPAPWGGPPREKPDVCTPSGFCEDDDPSRINSGTSAATGLAAGVLAAIRSNWGPDKLSPGALKDAINASARGQGGVWNARTGHGVLDAGALLRRLSTAAA